ncbi:hypothetical protein [Candidatus Pyrohabitans sp.]
MSRMKKEVKFKDPELEARYQKVKGAIKYKGSSVELVKELRAGIKA